MTKYIAFSNSRITFGAAQNLKFSSDFAITILTQKKTTLINLYSKFVMYMLSTLKETFHHVLQNGLVTNIIQPHCMFFVCVYQRQNKNTNFSLQHVCLLIVTAMLYFPEGIQIPKQSRLKSNTLLNRTYHSVPGKLLTRIWVI